MSARRRVGASLVLLAAAVVAGCSDDGGPGTLTVSVTGPEPLGAVAVELLGKGIQGVSLQSPGWVQGHPFQEGNQEGYRIVAVLETAGDVLLEVRVSDVSAGRPRATILEASGTTDLPLPSVSGLEVQVQR